MTFRLDPNKEKEYRESKKWKSHRITIQNVKAKASDKDVPENKNKDEQGIRRFAQAMEISKLDPKISIPVLLQILLEIKAKLPAQPAEPSATAHVVEAAISVFGENDVTQNLFTPFLITKIKTFTKEHITSGLNDLVGSAKNITVAADTMDLWSECALWLEGLYRRVFNKIDKIEDKDGKPILDADGREQPLKLKDGTYTTCDYQDGLFKSFVGGLTKMVISDYYHDAAVIIEAAVEAYRNDQLLKLSTSKLDISAPAPEQPAMEPVDEMDVQESINIVLPANNPDLIERIRRMVQEMVEYPEKEYGALRQQQSGLDEMDVLVMILESVKNENDEVKIATLAYAIDECELSGSQKRVVDKLKESAISALDHYLNRRFPRDYLFSRTHVEDAKNAKLDLGAAAEPKEYLQILLNLRNKLIGERSDDLITKVNNVLLNAFNMLLRLQFGKDNRIYALNRGSV